MKSLIARSVVVWVLLSGAAWGQEAPLSDATQECLECHTIFHPGIVADWRNGRHAAITPQEAM